jgi:hypothetical protein
MQVERSPELERLTQESNEAWDRGDSGWFRDHLSRQDPIMFGSAPDEEMRGSETITEVMDKAMSDRESWPFKPKDRRVVDARECGDVGWSLVENKWEFEDGTYVPTRGLTIWHREDGDWKMVLGLVAPAFSNDLLRGGSPVTQRAEAPIST